MTRYLIRSLVAILTFSIGLAVSYRPRLEHVERNYDRVHTCDRYKYIEKADLYALPSPVLSIANRPTDPLQIRYSISRASSSNFARRTVDFVAENQSGRDITSFTIGYNSGSDSTRSGGGAITVNNSDGTSMDEKFSIDSDVDEMLTVWVSSVHFKDGSTWTNPLRHE